MYWEIENVYIFPIGLYALKMFYIVHTCAIFLFLYFVALFEFFDTFFVFFSLYPLFGHLLCCFFLTVSLWLFFWGFVFANFCVTYFWRFFVVLLPVFHRVSYVFSFSRFVIGFYCFVLFHQFWKLSFRLMANHFTKHKNRCPHLSIFLFFWSLFCLHFVTFFFASLSPLKPSRGPKLFF